MRKSFSSLLFVLVVGAAGTACTASGSARYSASYSTPSMVYISPGVQVIEDYEEPVFYSSNVYWRFNGGVWYQSRTYTGGWVRVSTPPAAIVRIEQPSMYVHYRASAHGGATAAARPSPVQQREIQQDRREEKREIQQERREEKQEAQQERKEEKREAQQERKEDKQERKEDKQERKEDKQERKEDKRDNGHGNGHGKK